MQSLIAFAIRALEGLFVVGLVGSTLVLLITLKEDLEIMFGGPSEV